MAGLQSWHRHTQLVRLNDNGHTCAPSDDTSYSTSPGADESKLRPRHRRSLATFASSYLGTHHRLVSPSNGSEWPSIDWSKLSIDDIDDKEGDYKRDTEIMCTTILQQVLVNPSTDLPAQYNTFLLHLIEAYHQSKVDVQDLQMKLAEQTKSDKTKVDGFHGDISSWPREKTRMPEQTKSDKTEVDGSYGEVSSWPREKTRMSEGSESPENASSSTLPSTRSTRVQQYNHTIQIPLPSIDRGQKGQKQGHADEFKSKSLKASHLRHADLKQHRSVIN